MNTNIDELVKAFRSDPSSFIHELKFELDGFNKASAMLEKMKPAEIEQFMRMLIH
jgi:hypothetical protein